MKKILNWLKVFFMISDEEKFTYSKFRNYDGPFFSRFKKSEYFIEFPKQYLFGIIKIENGINKSEVASFAPETKVLMILAFLIFDFGFVFLIFRSLIADLSGTSLSTKIFNAAIILFLIYFVFISIPRIIFLLTNFKRHYDEN